MAAPTMTPVSSSNLKAIGFDEATETLHVEFNGSGTYAYEKVPRSLFDEFVSAESAGRFFAANVRGKFGHKPVPVEAEPEQEGGRAA